HVGGFAGSGKDLGADDPADPDVHPDKILPTNRFHLFIPPVFGRAGRVGSRPRSWLMSMPRTRPGGKAFSVIVQVLPSRSGPAQSWQWAVGAQGVRKPG